MSLGDWFRRVLGRTTAVCVPSPDTKERSRRVPIATSGSPNSGPAGADGERVSAARREQATAWLAAFEAGCLDPPRDVHDRGAWDDYWKNQMKVGAMEQGLWDGMASDTTLPKLLSRRGSRTILCAGNGLSTEAISLALHGFSVTALDISGVPAEVFGNMMRDPGHPVHRIPGFSMRDDGSVTFSAPGPIDPEWCPPMHRSTDHPPKGGGSLLFVTGDLMNPGVCPGPFDVVIERRTLQLFQGLDKIAALEHLVARLGERGTFVSHQHEGGGRPGDARAHYAEAWLNSRGFVLRSEAERGECDSAARLACLMFSTG